MAKTLQDVNEIVSIEYGLPIRKDDWTIACQPAKIQPMTNTKHPAVPTPLKARMKKMKSVKFTGVIPMEFDYSVIKQSLDERIAAELKNVDITRLLASSVAAHVDLVVESFLIDAAQKMMRSDKDIQDRVRAALNASVLNYEVESGVIKG